jgi:hypothetical protein
VRQAVAAFPPLLIALASTVPLAAGCQPPPSFIAQPNDTTEADAASAEGGGGGAGGDQLGGEDAGVSADAAALGPRPFSIVVLPDTQYYSAGYTQIFEAQTKWIVANRAALNIAFVLHEGDIVDSDVGAQWQNASRSLHHLDGQVPYFVTVGNHDIGSNCTNRNCRSSLINDFFPVSGFSGTSWFGGTFEPDHIENSYGIVPVDGGPWLVLSLEFGPRDQVLEWAGAVLDAHPDLPALVVTHAYLYNDGSRYDHFARPDQLWSPHGYDLDWLPGGVNDGEEMWQALVSKHDNLKLVLSGHALPVDPNRNPDSAARLTSMRASGSHCHQVLANYQTCSGFPCPETMGGDGFLRIIRFDPATHGMTVRTYSPYLDRWKTDPPNEFVLGGD